MNAVSTSSVCPLACAAMIPALVVAVVHRLDVYTTHASRALRAG